MPNKKRKKSISTRAIGWVIFLTMVVCGVAFWLLWTYKYTPSHHFEYIIITANGEQRKVLSGGSLNLHPSDKIKITEISTTLPIDYGVRLTSTAFDVDALRYEEMKISSLLPGDIFEHYNLRVYVKYRNEVLGHTDWDIQPFVEDWIEKADRIIDIDRRLNFLQKAVRTMPDQDLLKKRLLAEYKKAERWKEAAVMLEKEAEKKEDWAVLSELLAIYRAGKYRGKVTNVMERLMALNPSDNETRKKLARRYERNGDYKTAIDHYEKLLKYSEGREKAEAYVHLGYLYSKMGEEEMALSSYLEAAEFVKDDANIYYNISELYKKMGREDKANEYLERAVALQPSDLKGHLSLAESLIAKGNFQGARKHLSAVLEKTPGSIKALRLMAKLLETEGDREGLMEIYAKILSFDATDHSALYNLAALEYEADKLEKSSNHFEEYLKLKPGDVNAREILFDIYRRQGMDDKAYEQAVFLLENVSKDIELHGWVFGYLSKKGEYREMTRIMEDALASNPDETKLREYLIIGYLKTGRDELASKQMEEVLKSKPEDVELLLRLALLKESMGDYKGALEAYKAILDISPDHKEAGEAYLRIRLKGVGSDSGG